MKFFTSSGLKLNLIALFLGHNQQIYIGKKQLEELKAPLVIFKNFLMTKTGGRIKKLWKK